jgi:membrane protease YdiL (CAAX protease family)
LLEPEPLDRARLLRDSLSALGVVLFAALIVFPPYYVGYVWWWQPREDFTLRFAGSMSEGLTEVVGQWLMVGIPEEMFYRGYLQTEFDDRSERRFRVLGVELGPGVLWASVIFAVGHYLTVPHPARLAVFFPSLLFGFLRNKTGGIGATALFHALCNLFALLLGRSFGLIP